MTEKLSVLVVEDEEAIREGICDVLVFHGYAPVGVGDGVAGLAEAQTGRHDLAILDVMLPGLDGFSICRRLRQSHPRQAIMMLTARGDEADILEGFRCGADDYISKPFSVAQLIARVHALLRRSGARPVQRFVAGPLQIDAEQNQAHHGESMIDISPRDVEVLAWLVSAEGRTVSRAELLTEVWGYQRVESVQTRCVDMHIAKLRRKLTDLTEEAVIETVRGSGYRVRT
jgi:DNA-binding response OmpR family regulator